MSLRELAEVLAGLPPHAWPYGRWVLLTEPALGSDDTEPREEDVERTRLLLGRIGVETQALAI
jgi:hypothetical protein